MPAFSLNRSSRHRCFICAVLLTGLLAAGAGVLPARAQQPPLEWRNVLPLCEGEPSGDQRKSVVLAFAFSTGGTAVPLLAAQGLGETRASAFLGGAGIAFGPSLGNYYAENCKRAWTGLAIRGAGGTIMTMGAIFGLASGFSNGGGTAARVMMKAGLVTVAAGAIYDIVTAPISAAEYNEAHDVRMGFAPTIGPRGTQVGLALQVSF